MANELWKQRVQRAQEAAAGRRGVDVSVMLPPRNPSADGSTHQAEKAVAEPIAAPVVMEAVAVVETAAPAAAPAPAASSEAADRVAAAKAKAAAKAASADKPAAPAPKPAAPRPAAPAEASPVAEAPAEVGQAGMNRRRCHLRLGRGPGISDTGRRSGNLPIYVSPFQSRSVWRQDRCHQFAPNRCQPTSEHNR